MTLVETGILTYPLPSMVWDISGAMSQLLSLVEEDAIGKWLYTIGQRASLFPHGKPGPILPTLVTTTSPKWTEV